jgi:zinc protease
MRQTGFLGPFGRQGFGLAASFAFLAALAATPADAMDIKRVTSPGGIEAWLVENHANP